MSHVAKIELEINDLQVLQEAVRALGWQFAENKRDYVWFGAHVGDYPMPEGFTEADLGKCDHAIQVPGCDYEIGVIKKGKFYTLLWDFWDLKLLAAVGEAGCRLKQAYGVARIKKVARKQGYAVKEVRTETGIQLRLRGKP